MARIRPFRSGRPPKALAARVASVPYDVVDTQEARALAAGNPVSFLHVCRPEIDLPETTDIHADEVYAKGRENLDRFFADGTLVGDPVPRLLIYRQTWRGRSQDGFVAACSVDDYDTDVIRKHEKTRKDKEDDRVRHLLTQSAHAEPVFLTYRAVDAIDARVAAVTAQAARVRFRGARRGPAHALARPGDGRRVLRLGVRGGAAPLRGRRPPPLRERVARPRGARGEGPPRRGPPGELVSGGDLPGPPARDPPVQPGREGPRGTGRRRFS